MIDKSQVKVLVVDDEPFVLKIQERALVNLGFSSIVACEGAVHALQTIDKAASPPDLVLLDLNMPEMDGIEFLRHLVKRNYPGGLILLSGEDERVLQAAEKLVEAHQISLFGHLRKPLKIKELETLLENWKPDSRTAGMSQRKIYSPGDVELAIDNGEIFNHYQPMISLDSGQVLGTEALVRWMHPQDGLVYPDQFINVAEERGLISTLTRRVITAALAQTRHWNKELGKPLRTTINVSMDDLGSLDFADYIAAQASAMDIPPQHVTLEVTESRLMKDRRIALDVLTRLRLKRFRLSIDDFGTGHSSLAQLRDIPFDELKIDRGFVHGTNSDRTSRAIFNMSVMLGKQLKMGIVAEGVEDRTDWDFVRSSGCDVAQGYFVAKPMPAASVLDWVEKWRRRQPVTNVDTQKTNRPDDPLIRVGNNPLEHLLVSIVQVTQQRDRAELEACIARAIMQLTDADTLTLYHLKLVENDYLVVPNMRFEQRGEEFVNSSPLSQPFPLSSNALLSSLFHRPHSERIAESNNAIGKSLIVPLHAARGEMYAYCQVENARNELSFQRVLSSLLQIYTNFLSLLDDNERDVLTGLLNRKTFDQRTSKILSNLHNQHNRSKDSSKADHYCLAALDIDHFKRINDTLGHAYGDEVLLLFSNLMKETFRDNDLLFRFGGEEFVVLLSVGDMKHESTGLERFRRTVQSYRFPGIGQVTVSIGVASITTGEMPRTTMDRADQALYFAKQNGRNQVCKYEELVENGLLKVQDIQHGEIELF